ncbi:MAG: 23S rRNA pseudouridine(1911/1915/1917) synthase [Candidatus Westeberhardia cardiocondylae]|nr:23S rRNA pseudouridine(1911/1915/1917) synthase [Candidatus Westeberhardia cardiocondylae]
MTKQKTTYKKAKNNLQYKQRLDKALTKLFPEYSRSKIKNHILHSLVKINEKIITSPKTSVYGGEIIEITKIQKKFFWKAQNIPLNIIYYDKDIIVINKSKNMVVHPGHGNIDGTLLNALLHYYPPIINIPRAGIVHRLDKNTTGLIVVAKTILAQNRLINLIKKRKITRIYEAIVIGTIKENGSINEPIKRHNIKRTNMIVHPMGKESITHYSVIESFSNHTHLKIILETGRTHQIRVHMKHINHPIVGDPTYGKSSLKTIKKIKKNYKTILSFLNRQALHAKSLIFPHPITLNKMQLHTPLPDDIKKLIKILKKN